MTQLDRYIAAHALRYFIFAAFGLTALFSLLEFVEQLRSVGQGHYHLVDALAYVALLSPSKLLQAAPVSMLLASLLGLGGLASGSELTAMRALGISERRIAGALFKLAVPILAVLFLMAEFVIPPAQQFAQAERTAKLSSSAPVHGGDGFWAQADRQYLNVEHFGFGNVPRDINIYAFTADGALASYIHADRAIIRPDGTWLLSEVVRKRLHAAQFQTEYLASLAWHSFLPQQQAQLLVLPPDAAARFGIGPPAGTASRALASKLSSICSRCPSPILAVAGSTAGALSSTDFSSAAGRQAAERSLLTASTGTGPGAVVWRGQKEAGRRVELGGRRAARRRADPSA